MSKGTAGRPRVKGAWGRPHARDGEQLYAYRVPGGRREVQSGERPGEGELIMRPYIGLAPKKAALAGYKR